MESEGEILAEMRSRSRLAVHQVFATLTVAALALGLTAHHAPGVLLLPAEEANGIANGFLYMGAAYVATLFAWDWIVGAE